MAKQKSALELFTQAKSDATSVSIQSPFVTPPEYGSYKGVKFSNQFSGEERDMINTMTDSLRLNEFDNPPIINLRDTLENGATGMFRPMATIDVAKERFGQQRPILNRATTISHEMLHYATSKLPDQDKTELDSLADAEHTEGSYGKTFGEYGSTEPLAYLLSSDNYGDMESSNTFQALKKKTQEAASNSHPFKNFLRLIMEGK